MKNNSTKINWLLVLVCILIGAFIVGYILADMEILPSAPFDFIIAAACLFFVFQPSRPYIKTWERLAAIALAIVHIAMGLLYIYG